MKRPIYVSQRENDHGEFWYTVSAGNAEPVLTSKMYRKRWRAVRAAESFIASIAPAPVTFSWWTGPTHASIQAGTSRGKVEYHTEAIR